MALLCAKLCIVSTPEHGGPPDERDGYSVPVISGLERLAGYAGLEAKKRIDMPANNLLLQFVKVRTPPSIATRARAACASP